MNVIAQLTDREILGLDGFSTRPPRCTARAIVRNTDGLYAVMYAKKYRLYSLPGGGIEEGEDVLTALRREVYEETGCVCEDIQELGIIMENRGTLDYTQINYYYVVTGRRAGEMHLTSAEQNAGTQVQWHTLERVAGLIKNQHFERVQGKYLVARDVAAIDSYSTKNASTIGCIT